MSLGEEVDRLKNKRIEVGSMARNGKIVRAARGIRGKISESDLAKNQKVVDVKEQAEDLVATVFGGLNKVPTYIVEKTVTAAEVATGASKYREKALQINTELESVFSHLQSALAGRTEEITNLKEQLLVSQKSIEPLKAEIESKNLQIQFLENELAKKSQQNSSLPTHASVPAASGKVLDIGPPDETDYTLETLDGMDDVEMSHNLKKKWWNKLWK